MATAEEEVPRRLPVAEPETVRFGEEGEVHLYQVDLEAGDFLYVEADQLGVDLRAALLDAGGEELIAVDSPGGAYSRERLGFVAEQAGRFTVAVRTTGSLRQGRYAIRARTPRPADEHDTEYALACRRVSDADALRREASAPSLQRALFHYFRAGQRFHQLSRPLERVIARNRAAQVLEGLGRPGEARERYREALEDVGEIPGNAGSPLDLAAQKIDLLLRVAVLYRQDAQPEAAFEANEEARRLAHEIGNRSGEATALHGLATISFHRGKFEEAMGYFRQAAGLYGELGDLKQRSGSLHKLGGVFTILQRPRDAAEAFEEALSAGREASDPFAVAQALLGLGWSHQVEDRFERALELYGEAEEIAQEQGDSYSLASVLGRQGTVYVELERFDEAYRRLTEALRIWEERKDVSSQSRDLVNLGHLHAARTETEKALESFRRALALLRQAEDHLTEADVLLFISRAERALGRLEAAWAHGAEALDVLESFRSQLRDPENRMRVLVEPRRKFYEENVDLLMDLARQKGDPSYEARAFAVSERNRARVLLDLLNEAERDGTRDEPITVDGVGKLVGTDTVVLTYFLGERRSFLWRIGRDGFETHVLAPRDQVESVARKLHAALKSSYKTEARGPLRVWTEELGRMVLEDVAVALGHRRLVIVADGALQFVPFAVLTNPSTGEPLIADHEIVYLPSASVLKALRRAADGPAKLRTVAVLADPVTDRSDERLGSGGRRQGTGASSAAFPRLRASAEEARHILSLLPRERTLGAFGFDARLELVRSGALRGYDVVHFAVHGTLDSERPDRSSLVLSLYDRDGSPRDGLLRLADVYGLELSAELVVASACNTALGEEIHGEGLVGLTRGFLSAGASRVAVSLWDVHDQGTAELMKRFYRAVLEEGLSPAAALATAQRSMHEDPVFSAPFYWAAFVLQGDWR